MKPFPRCWLVTWQSHLILYPILSLDVELLMNTVNVLAFLNPHAPVTFLGSEAVTANVSHGFLQRPSDTVLNALEHGHRCSLFITPCLCSFEDAFWTIQNIIQWHELGMRLMYPIWKAPALLGLGGLRCCRLEMLCWGLTNEALVILIPLAAGVILDSTWE